MTAGWNFSDAKLGFATVLTLGLSEVTDWQALIADKEYLLQLLMNQDAQLVRDMELEISCYDGGEHVSVSFTMKTVDYRCVEVTLKQPARQGTRKLIDDFFKMNETLLSDLVIMSDPPRLAQEWISVD